MSDGFDERGTSSGSDPEVLRYPVYHHFPQHFQATPTPDLYFYWTLGPSPVCIISTSTETSTEVIASRSTGGMDLSDNATLAYGLLALVSLSALAFLLSQPTDFAKWVQKKKYQYEVTFALYMLTPTEKFIFSE